MAGDLKRCWPDMSNGNLEKITMRMLDKDKLPKIEPLTG